LGRNKKILADLCLLSGLYPEALVHYSNSVEHLRGINDHLWMGAGLEGACAANNMMVLGDEVLKSPSKARYSRGLIIDQTNIQVNVNIDSTTEEQIKNVVIFSNNEMISKYSECLSCFKRFHTGPLEMESHFKFIRALIRMKVCRIRKQNYYFLYNSPFSVNKSINQITDLYLVSGVLVCILQKMSLNFIVGNFDTFMSIS